MRWCFVLLAGLAVSANAADPVPLEALVGPLLGAQTYCETGTWGASISPNAPMATTSYRLCAHRDGRFKFTQDPGQSQQVVMWSDTRKLHRYVEYGRGYQSYPIGDVQAEYAYGRTREAAPALHSRLLRWATRTAAGRDLAGSLRDYQANAGLSNAKHAVYERFDADRRGSSRIFVNVAEGAIVRYENFYDGVLRGFVELSTRELNRPLTEEDLSSSVPLAARFSLQNNAPGFLAALFLFDAAIGVAFWYWRMSGEDRLQAALRTRRRLWRWLGWAAAAVALALGLLAAATWGGSGHPPAIIYVAVIAMWAVVGFGLVACFLLASHVAQGFSGRPPQA